MRGEAYWIDLLPLIGSRSSFYSITTNYRALACLLCIIGESLRVDQNRKPSKYTRIWHGLVGYSSGRLFLGLFCHTFLVQFFKALSLTFLKATHAPHDFCPLVKKGVGDMKVLTTLIGMGVGGWNSIGPRHCMFNIPAPPSSFLPRLEIPQIFFYKG